MDWVLEEHNKRNHQRHELAAIDQGMQKAWEQICEAISQTVYSYSGLPGANRVELGPSTPDTVDMAVYRRRPTTLTPIPVESDELLARATIKLDVARRAVVVTYLDGSEKTFPFAADAGGNVFLMHKNHRITPAEFTKEALRETLFA
ncbi:MAG: hypothetical protein EPO02_12980 [Nitrospirae bacterium]|nr:MAG: hypothetical protein EPO02_12980 [Nitrospirota bacterium]